jgi:hypothetical protein
MNEFLSKFIAVKQTRESWSLLQIKLQDFYPSWSFEDRNQILIAIQGV